MTEWCARVRIGIYVCVRAYTKLSRRKGDVIMIQLHEDMQIEITKRLHITFLLLFILCLFDLLYNDNDYVGWYLGFGD